MPELKVMNTKIQNYILIIETNRYESLNTHVENFIEEFEPYLVKLMEFQQTFDKDRNICDGLRYDHSLISNYQSKIMNEELRAINTEFEILKNEQIAIIL